MSLDLMVFLIFNAHAVLNPHFYLSISHRAKEMILLSNADAQTHLEDSLATANTETLTSLLEVLMLPQINAVAQRTMPLSSLADAASVSRPTEILLLPLAKLMTHLFLPADALKSPDNSVATALVISEALARELRTATWLLPSSNAAASPSQMA